MLTTDSKVDSCSTSPYSITIGGRLTLHCPVSGYPPPIVTWMKNGTERQIGEDSKFTIVSAKEEDFGIYTCMATDGENTLVQCNISVVKEIGGYIKMRSSCMRRKQNFKIGIFWSKLHSCLRLALVCLTESRSFGYGLKDFISLHKLVVKVV